MVFIFGFGKFFKSMGHVASGVEPVESLGLHPCFGSGTHKKLPCDSALRAKVAEKGTLPYE